ncbi:hypothetical protein [Helicobacter cinaedi]|uniref:hypothetical protein n=1 Tax=Helicobacter cinaedi TaxID=213 RepID=UPI000DA1CD51|nr:hypothetical protein [Helicobacter cinaedi]
MSHISSINFKKSKDFQVFHNANIRPNYAIGTELSYNRKGYEALKIKQELIQNAIEAYNRTNPPPPKKKLQISKLKVTSGVVQFAISSLIPQCKI